MDFENLNYGGYLHTYRDQQVIEDWLAALTYKPGTTLFVSGDFGSLSVRLTASVFDTYRGAEVLVRLDDRDGFSGRVHGSFTGPLIKAQARWTVPPYFPEQGEEEFRSWLRHQLHEWERHESDEWLREKGVAEPIFDPHRTDYLR